MVTGRALRPVVGLGTGTGVDGRPRAIFGDATLGVGSVEIIERLVAEVAVPVDAHVLIDAGVAQSADGAVCDGADGPYVGRCAERAGEVVGEVTRHATAHIPAGDVAVVDFRGGGVAVVRAGIVLHAGEDLQAVDVWVQVAHVFGVAMAESRGG